MSDKLKQSLSEAAKRHIAAYCSPKPWDADAIWEEKASGCEHYLQPAESLDPQYQGNIDEDKHRHFMEFFGPIFTSFKMEIMWEAIDTDRLIVVHGLDCTMDLKAFGDEPALNGYKAHYVWTLWFNEDMKITKMEEMMNLDRLIGNVSKRAGRYAEYMKSQGSQ